MNADVLPAADAAAQAAARVRVPAIIQIVLWALGALNSVSMLVMAMAGVNTEALLDGMRKAAQQNPDAEKVIEVYARILTFYSTYAVPMAVVGMVIVLLGLIGSIRMLQLKSYGLAIIAAVLTLLPCMSPCCCIGLPVGIWSLVVLSNAQVRQQFT